LKKNSAEYAAAAIQSSQRKQRKNSQPATAPLMGGWYREKQIRTPNFQIRTKASELGATGGENVGYILHLSIDYTLKMRYKIPILAHREASPETILKAERGVASCGGGS
jgi:hypothetical protein